MHEARLRGHAHEALWDFTILGLLPGRSLRCVVDRPIFFIDLREGPRMHRPRLRGATLEIVAFLFDCTTIIVERERKLLCLHRLRIVERRRLAPAPPSFRLRSQRGVRHLRIAVTELFSLLHRVRIHFHESELSDALLSTICYGRQRLAGGLRLRAERERAHILWVLLLG